MRSSFKGSRVGPGASRTAARIGCVRFAQPVSGRGQGPLRFGQRSVAELRGSARVSVRAGSAVQCPARLCAGSIQSRPSCPAGTGRTIGRIRADVHLTGCNPLAGPCRDDAGHAEGGICGRPVAPFDPQHFAVRSPPYDGRYAARAALFCIGRTGGCVIRDTEAGARIGAFPLVRPRRRSRRKAAPMPGRLRPTGASVEEKGV